MVRVGHSKTRTEGRALLSEPRQETVQNFLNFSKRSSGKAYLERQELTLIS